MKATGIVRRIDDLGRVVIPKEIRRTQMIRVGDPLEIFVTDGGDVVFRKYSPLGELGPLAQRYVTALARSAGLSAAVSDRDRVLAASGGAKQAEGKEVSADLAHVMDSRRAFTAKPGEAGLSLCADGPDVCRAAVPILCHGDLIGCVALAGEPDETALALIQTAAAFFAAHLEE